MKKLVLTLALLCLCLTVSNGVINNGLLSWQPNGAINYSVWKRAQGSASYQLLGTVVTPPFAVPSALPSDYLYVRSKHLDTNGLCCVESDFGFVIAQPHIEGTNELRWIPSTEGLIIQTTYGPANGWTNMLLFEGLMLRTRADMQGLLRTARTNLPPKP